MIRITTEDPNSTDATMLIAELSAELKNLYHDSHGGDGSGTFKPQDVTIPRSAFVIAWDDENPVGCGALRPMEEAHIVEVKRMFVRPSARRKGISRLILSTLEALARDFDYSTVRLETGMRNPEAMRLYETSGYERIACYGIYVNEPLSVCYEKNL